MTASGPFRGVAPAFDHREPGTDEQQWLAAPQWADVARARPAEVLGDVDNLVVLAAHPDDETLGCAGLVSAASAAGVPVTVVVATLGESSHPASRTHTAGQLAARREEEVRCAVGEVAAAARVEVLRLPDGRLEDHEAELAAALARVVKGSGTLLLAPWRHDGHCDHEAAGRVAAGVAASAGARLLEYPVWLWHWGTPEGAPWGEVLAVDLSPEHVTARRAALGLHASQTAPLSDEPGDEVLLGPHVLAHFDRPFEAYLRHLSADGPDDPRDAVFDGMFESSEDPWDVDSSWYERRKRAATLAAPLTEPLGRVLEVGCSTGVLTAELAARADSVLALDVSAEALRRAGERLSSWGDRVELRRARVPRDWPEGTFDLVVLSEVGYFWTPEDLGEVTRRLPEALAPGGTVLLCDWRHPVDGWPLDGEDVHEALRGLPGLEVLVRHEEQDFLVELLGPAGTASPARREGKA
ncbi:bifunctional PIG-L family deacetylase/class I SAM-dependent methyltransferase [Phycicoccus sp. M110.8]|uniref:bifunctional PIG-L family deacetylase/class I SAM-dependent methyltransferase n=1 Tax=Phycicoccus sp. M110.8 TaxID=3075433 RepID=UPI0028FD46C9|nr:bifunctional PIG-L family deacetylase/class I SAM-dependent methyltransferase [Phycicoccus sp. M110.8]MDU0315845.1 bifunctional PIG-L family deacetylase/class I SAM-dependent methyltransferase [Phycicoccus sp. M110.8]